MNKIDLIIDALRQAYEDTPGWVEKVNEAIYAARKLQQELAKPEQDINILHIGTDVIEEGMHLIVRRGNEIIHSQFYEAPKRQWVGLTSEDWENTPDTGKQGCERDAELFDWIEQTLKDKNT